MKTVTLGLLIAFLFFAGCTTEKNGIFLHVNDEPVTLSELEFWMSLSKAEVSGYFFREYGVQQTADFWEKSYGQESPSEMLKELAIKRLVECKVQQLFAKELGLIDNIGFDQLMSELQDFNEDRKIRHAKGEPIYGPIQFTSRTYFDHVFDKMVYDVKQYLLNEHSDLIINGVNDGGTQNGAPLENSGFYQMQSVDLVYEQMVAQRIMEADVRINADLLDL